ncbi:TRAP transporter permease [Kaustia mangrovi]|uniref:TRAP transporter permease n=1 Tax=Kaustia mangrovi TaxID=2593653 RepID=A0A7S8C5X3_9HYPH|nr:TRAP transporter permease [Kaustia mangrovi]QPC43911.1 TRAP transporter permease [Kaustia mangrovi]
MSEGNAPPRHGTGAEDLVAQTDTGARTPSGWVGVLLPTIAFVWSLFQLYVASGVPFWLQDALARPLRDATGLDIGFIFNNAETRIVHLAFALTLAALAFPLFKSSPRNRVPWYDWLLAILGAAACLYLLVFKEEIAMRAGLPTTADLVMSSIGLCVLAIAVYRALGLPLVVVAGVFVAYVFFGHSSFLPTVIQWKGASFGKAMWHYWMQLEGVFGVALGVSASMIFLFVLFGSILEKAGAGNFFIKIAFALLGHLRGGPAKAAVVSSAMSGIYSGSSIANTVTTGTFTIPLMKRTGFPPEKAGAVEVASSTNGQLTPPVMGAAAFLIAEYTGIGYIQVIKHALLPALISYIALFYIVHLEAMKMDLKGLPKPPSRLTVMQKLLGVLGGFIAMAVLFLAVYFGLGWIKTAFPGLTFFATLGLFFAAYIILVAIAARYPDLTMDDPNAPVVELPRAGATAVTGLYFLLPLIVLIWCILIERFSPGLSAYWACLAMIVVALTQHPLKALFRGEGEYGARFRRGGREVVDGMISGARNMISIGVATAAAGIIVGTVSLTGMHQVVAEFVEFLSGGNLMLMLILVALMSLILGMGLPTTANYIVVSSLMAPVIVTVGAQSGLIVPLIAVHMFVFYFGILADDTPPVGLAAFAASAISRGDPIKTGVQGFMYDIRTAILPFLFIFNTELLLIDVTPVEAVFVFIVALIAMLLFAAATQGYFLTRNRLWESAALLLVAFTLFRPGYWLDQVQPPFEDVPPAQIFELVQQKPAGDELRVVVEGPDFDTGESKTVALVVPLGEEADGQARLEEAGLPVQLQDGRAVVEEPFPGTPFFEKIGTTFDFYGDQPVTVAEIREPAERMPKEVFYIPGLVLLALVVWLQRRRMPRKPEERSPQVA